MTDTSTGCTKSDLMTTKKQNHIKQQTSSAISGSRTHAAVSLFNHKMFGIRMDKHSAQRLNLGISPKSKTNFSRAYTNQTTRMGTKPQTTLTTTMEKQAPESSISISYLYRIPTVAQPTTPTRRERRRRNRQKTLVGARVCRRSSPPPPPTPGLLI